MSQDRWRDREQGFETVDAENRSAALRHLIHDGGIEIAAELTHQNGHNTIDISDSVLAQRRAGKGLYELDFAALGATPEQLERIAAHQAERRALEEAFVSKASEPELIGGVKPLAGRVNEGTGAPRLPGH